MRNQVLNRCGTSGHRAPRRYDERRAEMWRTRYTQNHENRTLKFRTPKCIGRTLERGEEKPFFMHRDDSIILYYRGTQTSAVDRPCDF